MENKTESFASSSSSRRRKRRGSSGECRRRTERLHALACERGDDTYEDPQTGLQVFTRLAHERRGQCCGCGCRHCPYRDAKGSKSRGGDDDLKDIEESSRSDATTTTTTKRTRSTPVYTKTGDKGTSSLFNGERVRKSDASFDALGDVDELTSCLGRAFEDCRESGVLADMCEKLEWCMVALIGTSRVRRVSLSFLPMSA